MGIITNIIESVSDSLENTEFNYKLGGTEFKDVILPDDIQFWNQSIRENLFDQHYANFNPKKLKMIVIGSSGKTSYYRRNKFNKTLAMVEEDGATGFVPFSVQNIIENLHQAFDPDSKLKIPKHQNRVYDYDLQCSQLMKEVLFINVCLSTSNSDMCNAACSIKFINELLKAEKEFDNQVAILDFRLTMHAHFSNDSNFSDDSWDILYEYNQDDCAFKVNPQGFHRYYRFCHPAYISESNNGKRISEKFVKMFKNIDRNGYPIKKMYMPYGSSW